MSSQAPFLSRQLFRHLNHINTNIISQSKHYRTTLTLSIPPSTHHFSTQSSPLAETTPSPSPSAPKAVCDISKHILGITNDDLEKHPALVEYLSANIPELLGMEPKTATEKLIENNPHVHHYFLHGEADGAGHNDGTSETKPTKTSDIVTKSKSKSKSKKQEFNNERTNTRHGLQRRALFAQQPSSPTAFHRNIRPLFSYLRDSVTEEGTRNCDTLRHQSYIPGVLYGTDPNLPTTSTLSNPRHRIFVKTPWSELQRELDLYTHNTFPSRVYDLTVFPNDQADSSEPGTTHRVVPRDVQFHPWKDLLYCCNYLLYHPGRPIDIPIVYTNEEESTALKRGGFIAPVNRYVSCIVEDGVDIPERIEMDCTGLRLKDVVRTERFVFPEGVVMSKKVNPDKFLVGTVFGRRGEMEAEGGASTGKGGVDDTE